MTKLNKEWIQKNKNRDIIANGIKSKFIDYITEMVLNEQMASFKIKIDKLSINFFYI